MEPPDIPVLAPRNSFGPAAFNNTMWDTATSEVLTEGTTEVWEIVNLTADAHPIHTHLAQCQILNRQNFDLSNYTKVYAAAFAGGVVLPGMGPPLNYLTGNPRALGGNPDITPFLKGAAVPPAAN